MKKIVCFVLCLIIIVSSAGCALKKLTFKEVSEAGIAFAKENGLKNISISFDGSTKGQSVKTVLEGTYDTETKNAVFSVTVDKEDTTQTQKDCVRISDGYLYYKISEIDLSDVFGRLGEGLFSSVYEVEEDREPAGVKINGKEYSPIVISGSLDEILKELERFSEKDGEETDGLDLNGLFGEIDSGGIKEILEKGLSEKSYTAETTGLSLLSWLTDITGKFIKIKLPETKFDTIINILDKAEQNAYEKAEKLDAEEKYPYVVKYTKEDAKELIISVLDGIKEGKDAIIAELKAFAIEIIGEDDLKRAENLSGKSFEALLSVAIDGFFENTKPEDIDLDAEENFECTQKVAYEKGQMYETVTEFKSNAEGAPEIKLAVTVTAADPDPDFAERCRVDEEKIYDPTKFLSNTLTELSFRAK